MIKTLFNTKFNLSLKQQDKFSKYYEYLILENSKYNLTAITKEEEVYIKHFYDSIIIMDYVSVENKKLCDIGSGAGFPAIPLKIVNENIKLTIIEPTLKKINFLKDISNILNLDDINFLNKRAEDILISERETYDIITSRAVANLGVLIELSLPYLKVGGLLIALKGAFYVDEVKASAGALKKLNAEIIDIKEYQLPLDYGKRSLIIIQKKEKTNQLYPRRFSEIKKKTL